MMDDRTEIERLRSENKRLQDLLDRRPAMNADLLDAYARWTSLCYQSDAAVAGRYESEIH